MATGTRRRRVDDDELEERRPRRRRRVDDEQAPRRRRPEPEPEPEEEADEPEDDDDVEEAPRARRPARSARHEGMDDEEDSPRHRASAGRGPSGRAGRRPGAASRPGGRVARGWDGYRNIKSSGDFETKFKPTSEGTIIALLEEEPFAAFARHWVETSEGKRAFICLASLENEEDEEPLEDPLCDVGDEPNPPKAYLNVAVLHPKKPPEHAVWEIGRKVSEQLQMIDKSLGKRTSLTDIYLEVSSKGSGFNTKYFVEPLFPEDLGDWGVKELTDTQRGKFELYDETLYPLPTLKELNRVADEIA